MVELVDKKKIVGVLALVFIVLVFFPLFFSGNGYRERHLPSIIPQRPDTKTFDNIEPLLKPLADTHKIAPLVEPVTSQGIAKKADQAVLDQQGVPVAWTLQLASFKDEANARSLRKQLLKAGHKVYTRKNGDLVKVYVGPELKRQRLESLKKELQEDLGLDGLLVRFTTH